MSGVIILAVYALIMISATLLFARSKKENKDDFYVGGRNMGVLTLALSVAATWIWAPALFTSAQQAYQSGFAGLFWFLVPNALCLIIFIPFAKRIRKEMPEGITLSGYMEKKYESKSVRNIYQFQLVALSVFSTAVQLLAGGKLLSMLTGIPFWIVTIILAAIALSYSVISGIKASVITDAFQMIFMLVMCTLFVPWALHISGSESLINGIGGFTGEFRSLFGKTGLDVFLGFGLPTTIGLISGPFGDQCFWQRAFSVKKDKIGAAFSLGSIFFAIVPLSMGILGFIAAGSGFVPDDVSRVNFELISSIFPSWVVFPFLFMLISGLLSTIDSNLCAVSSLTTDFSAMKNNRLAAVASMLLLLTAGIAIANIPGLTVTQLFLFYGTLRAATLLPTVLTLKGVKMRPLGVVAGIIIALCIGLPIFAYGNLNGIAIYKTAGSLTTVLTSGILALIISNIAKGDTKGC